MQEIYVLQDRRTEQYFGGGVADKLFQHWVPDALTAKKYFRSDLMLPTLKQMHKRGVENPLTEQNVEVLKAIPPFDPQAYLIHHYVDGALVDTTNIFSVLEQMAQGQA